MKNWTTPDVVEVEIKNTEYGGQVVSEFDNIYVNDKGEWEGTFAS